jgi:hypothetical protein
MGWRSPSSPGDLGRTTPTSGGQASRGANSQQMMQFSTPAAGGLTGDELELLC